VVVNAHLPGRDLRRRVGVRREGIRLLEAASARLGLSARAYTGILRVARTIADLGGSAEVGSSHVAEAIQYRSLDRPVGR
jgi:magnesium chelatase family protein